MAEEKRNPLTPSDAETSQKNPAGAGKPEAEIKEGIEPAGGTLTHSIPSQLKISELEKLKNENQKLLRKIDTLENSLENRGTPPTELETKAAKLAAGLKSMVRENSHMSSVIAGLYKTRKLPVEPQEHNYILSRLKKKITTYEIERKNLDTTVDENREKIEALENELVEEKKNHIESKKQIDEKLSETKKEHEKLLKEREETEKQSINSLEEKIKQFNEKLQEKNEETKTLSTKLRAATDLTGELSGKAESSGLRVGQLESEVKTLKEMVIRYREKSLESSDTTQAQQQKEIPEGDTDHWSSLVTSLLKERRAPSTNEELQSLLRRYKKRIIELQNHPAENLEIQNLKEQLKVREENKEKIGTLSIEIKELKEMIPVYQSTIKDHKATIKRYEDETSKHRTSPDRNEALNEYDEAMNFVKSLIKERKQPFNSDETQALVSKYKREIEELKIKIGNFIEAPDAEELKEKLIEMKTIKDQMASYQNENKELKVIIKKLKNKLDEISSEPVATNDPAPIRTPEDAIKELDEMSHLVASFLKERRLPSTSNEAENLIKKYKQEIETLRKKQDHSDKTRELQSELDVKNEEIGKLKTSVENTENDMKVLKKSYQKLKLELEETRETAKETIKNGINKEHSTEEFDEMSSLMAGMIKDRKRPTGTDESEKLVRKYKSEIARLKEQLARPVKNEQDEKLRCKVSELERELRETRQRLQKIETEEKETDLLIKLKDEVEEYKMKLASANNRLSLYGEEVIE